MLQSDSNWFLSVLETARCHGSIVRAITVVLSLDMEVLLQSGSNWCLHNMLVCLRETALYAGVLSLDMEVLLQSDSNWCIHKMLVCLRETSLYRSCPLS